MATNPNNAIGTNGAFGGRTSVNAFNDDLAIYSGRGIISGWACAPSSGLTVVLGGDGTTRDVAVAQDNAGNRTTINNISGSPVSVTLSGAPTANSRIDAIVAYVDNPPQGSATITDNYGACGIIAVSGTPAASPSAPTESAIRTAITADGASGTTAYFVVLATVTIAAGVTDITTDNITAGNTAQVRSSNSSPVPDGSITAEKIAPDAFIWEEQVAGTNCTCRLARIGKIGFLHLRTSAISYSGTSTSFQMAIPSGTIPNGATILQIQTSLQNQGVTGDQRAESIFTVPYTVSGGVSVGIEVYSPDSQQKSCVGVLLFVIELPGDN